MESNQKPRRPSLIFNASESPKLWPHLNFEHLKPADYLEVGYDLGGSGVRQLLGFRRGVRGFGVQGVGFRGFGSEAELRQADSACDLLAESLGPWVRLSILGFCHL